jgi:hypothetical protein
VSWLAGLGLAFGSAFVTNVAFLMRHRGAVAAPDVDIRRPVRSAIDLFSKKWWSIGFAGAAVAWGLHVASLKFAPLSLVQAVLASGFVILGVVAERFFGFKLRKREWVGIWLTAFGLAMLAVTAGETGSGGDSSNYKLAAAIAFEGALLLGGALCFMSNRVERMKGQHGPLLGAGAGLLFTVTHIAIKALTGSIDLARPETLLSGWILLVVAGGVIAFFASARSLQVGEAVPVIAITGVASNASAILAGVVVFGDPLGESPLLIALRIGAFALVVLAAAFMPAPVRAARHQEAAGQRAEAASPGARAPARATPAGAS